MNYANCPECNRETKASTWEENDGTVNGAVWCDYCGWNDNNSKAMKAMIQRRTAASLGLTVDAFLSEQAEAMRAIGRIQFAMCPDLAPF